MCSFGVGVYQFSSNLPAPINVSSTAQSKQGYLAIGTSTAPTIPLAVIGKGYFSGPVGIGTTAPKTALDVRGHVILSDGMNNAVFVAPSTGAWGFVFRTVTGDIDTYTSIGGTGNYINRLVINPSTGNVGIGNVEPGSRLEITGSDNLSTASALNVTNASSASLVYVRNNGNVGIGTTEPGAKLHIKGNSIISPADGGQSTSAYTYTALSIPDPTSVNNTGGFNYKFDNPVGAPSLSKAILEITDSNAHHYDFFLKVNNNDAITVKRSGNVGIGTTAPEERLDVNGIAQATTFELNPPATGNYNVRLVTCTGIGGANSVQTYWNICFGAAAAGGCLGAYGRSGNYAACSAQITNSETWTIYGFIGVAP